MGLFRSWLSMPDWLKCSGLPGDSAIRRGWSTWDDRFQLAANRRKSRCVHHPGRKNAEPGDLVRPRRQQQRSHSTRDKDLDLGTSGSGRLRSVSMRARSRRPLNPPEITLFSDGNAHIPHHPLSAPSARVLECDRCGFRPSMASCRRMDFSRRGMAQGRLDTLAPCGRRAA